MPPPVARVDADARDVGRVRVTLKMSFTYAQSLYKDPGATLGDLREAVTTLEDTERIVRRVLGGAHPLAVSIEQNLRYVRQCEIGSPPAKATTSERRLCKGRHRR